MTPLAWLGALAIGLTLGLLGSGGSILTVPVLVYLVGEPDKIAIAESLAIVGLIAAIGALPYAKRGLVSWTTVLLFGLPGMAGSYVGALAAKSIPGHVQLMLFAVLMLAAALSMLRPSQTTAAAPAPDVSDPCAAPAPRSWTAAPAIATASASDAQAWTQYRVIIVQGFGVGTLTGLVGVGGGFLVIPALVLVVGLPMHVAVGTSLSIVALNSATGFYKHAQVLAAEGLHLHHPIIGSFAAVGIVGSLTGSAICQYIPQQQLRRIFAIFVLVLGGFLLWKNLGR
jgi:uncharacterized membrane protein YfcA